MALTTNELLIKLNDLKMLYAHSHPHKSSVSFVSKIGIDSVASKLDNLIEGASRLVEYEKTIPIMENNLEQAKSKYNEANREFLNTQSEFNRAQQKLSNFARFVTVDKSQLEKADNEYASAKLAHTNASKKLDIAGQELQAIRNQHDKIKEDSKNTKKVIDKLIETFRAQARKKCGEGPHCVSNYIDKLMAEPSKHVFYRGIGLIIHAYYPNDPNYKDYARLNPEQHHAVPKPTQEIKR